MSRSTQGYELGAHLFVKLSLSISIYLNLSLSLRDTNRADTKITLPHPQSVKDGVEATLLKKIDKQCE